MDLSVDSEVLELPLDGGGRRSWWWRSFVNTIKRSIPMTSTAKMNTTRNVTSFLPNVFLLYGIGVGVGSPREWREIDNYYCQQWKGNFLYRLEIWRKFWVGIITDLRERSFWAKYVNWNGAFCFLICVDANKFVFLGVFTFTKEDLPKHPGTTTAQECKNHFRLTCVAQKRLCSSSLLLGLGRGSWTVFQNLILIPNIHTQILQTDVHSFP